MNKWRELSEADIEADILALQQKRASIPMEHRADRSLIAKRIHLLRKKLSPAATKPIPNDPNKLVVCTKCGVEKPRTTDFFYANPDGKDGLTRQCKKCRQRRQGKRRVGPEYNEKVVARRYGLTVPEYRTLLLDHKECAICGDMQHKLIVDHKHATNKIRGLLCNSCNLGLGYFKDRPELLTAAIAYLKNNLSHLKVVGHDAI